MGLVLGNTFSLLCLLLWFTVKMAQKPQVLGRGSQDCCPWLPMSRWGHRGQPGRDSFPCALPPFPLGSWPLWGELLSAAALAPCCFSIYIIGQGLKPFKLWASINPASFIVLVVGVVSKQWETNKHIHKAVSKILRETKFRTSRKLFKYLHKLEFAPVTWTSLSVTLFEINTCSFD